jgi:transposase
MTTPLSQDLRRRIVRTVEKGSSIRQAAARYEWSAR